jgi:PBSX family phage terminase large subunit
MKAALCTRRAGKSYAMGVLAVKTAAETANCKVVVIGKTNQSVKGIYFDDIMAVLKRKFNLDWELNRTEMIYRLPNGSMIMFMGADADQDQMNKLLGQKFKLAILDEASMYANIDLRKLIYGILRPALADLRGQMVMIGTPSDYLNSLYFDVTTLQEPGWATHKWTAFDNPHMIEQVTEELAFMRQANPKIDLDTEFRQHWLGEWVVNLSSRVYKYDKSYNGNEVPITGQYQHVLGVDLGFEDHTAFVIGAWSHYDRVLHIVHAESAPGLDLDQVEARMKSLQQRFNVGVITIDGAGKQFVETLQGRFQMGLHRAEKVHKKDFIELMNTDFVMGRINVFHDKCLPLVKEWENLIWDQKELDKDPKTGHIRGKWAESKNCPNHAADAALYMWRWCYNHANIPRVAPPTEEETMEHKHTVKIESQNDDPNDIIFDSEFDFGV